MATTRNQRRATAAANAPKATEATPSSNGLVSLGIEEAAEPMAFRGPGVHKEESAYTKAVREAVKLAAETRKTYTTSFTYLEDEKLPKDAVKLVATMQRVSKDYGVSMRFGSDHPKGEKPKGAKLLFCATDRITRTRKPKADETK